MTDLELTADTLIITAFAVIFTLWVVYIELYLATSDKIEKAFSSLKSKRKRMRRSYLQMLAKVTNEEEIDSILNLCLIPLREKYLELKKLLESHNNSLTTSIRLIAFVVAEYIIFFEALATTAYISQRISMTSVEFFLLFTFFGLIGLAVLVVLGIIPELKRKKTVQEAEELIKLLEESAIQKVCVEDLEELLEESR